MSITLEYRSDVDTCKWWAVRWGKEPQCFAAAKSLELALFRAAVLARKDDERAKKYAGIDQDAERNG